LHVAITLAEPHLGLGFSFGSREIGHRPNIPGSGGLDVLWDPFAGLKFRYVTYKLIIGFAI
jgi:hypothetical protein